MHHAILNFQKKKKKGKNGCGKTRSHEQLEFEKLPKRMTIEEKHLHVCSTTFAMKRR